MVGPNLLIGVIDNDDNAADLIKGVDQAVC